MDTSGNRSNVRRVPHPTELGFNTAYNPLSQGFNPDIDMRMRVPERIQVAGGYADMTVDQQLREQQERDKLTKKSGTMHVPEHIVVSNKTPPVVSAEGGRGDFTGAPGGPNGETATPVADNVPPPYQSGPPNFGSVDYYASTEESMLQREVYAIRQKVAELEKKDHERQEREYYFIAATAMLWLATVFMLVGRNR